MTENGTRRGLFLDLDGTLADSVPVMRIVYRRFLEKFGKTGSDKAFQRLNGPPLRDVVAVLKHDHALALPIPELIADYTALINEAYRSVVPTPGAQALLEAANQTGWVVGVVTSAGEGAAQAWLAHVGLAEMVATVVGAETGGAGKPHPDPYLVALKMTDCAIPVSVAASVAVEDSPQGACAAVAAGLKTYVLGAAPADVGEWPAVAGFIGRLDDLIEILADA